MSYTNTYTKVARTVKILVSSASWSTLVKLVGLAVVLEHKPIANFCVVEPHIAAKV